MMNTETLVCEDIILRQGIGLIKYGQSVADNPLGLRQWLQHAYEETLDNAIYLKRAMQEIDAKEKELDFAETAPVPAPVQTATPAGLPLPCHTAEPDNHNSP